MNYPKTFIDLEESFQKLPGVGEKSSERYLYSVLKLSQEDVEEFAANLINFKTKIKKCSICGHYTEEEICPICLDETRDKSILCVVEDSKTVFMFEKVGNFNGQYHVLDGLISPMNGINPEDINLNSLINNRINENIKEIIIAINPSIEGETTSLYIQKLLDGKNIKISRLSYGIPMGSDIEYMDPIIIEKALEDRKYIS